MSSEKQYNDIENKIKEAADGYNYPFSETAWEKMENLLDKEQDRRRPLFWIFTFALLAVLVAGGIYFFRDGNQQGTIERNRQNAVILKGNTTQGTFTDENNPSTNSTSPVVSENTNTGAVIPRLTQNTTTETKNQPSGAVNNTVSLNKKNTGSVLKIKIKKATTENDMDPAAATYPSGDKKIYKNQDKIKLKISTPEVESELTDAGNKPNVNTPTNNVERSAGFTEPSTDSLKKEQELLKPDTAVTKNLTATEKEDKKNKKERKFAGFYLVGNLGAEASSTKFLQYKHSTVTPRYGIAAGYQLNKRFSIQAGFYASAKKYIAGPGDYYAKPGSYLSNVNIIKVDANCLVYEIPVSVQYNWLSRPKINYYAGIGLSSYLMKKEEYYYTVERYNVIYTYPYAYTKNTHLFAGLTLSAGIEKKLNRKFYLQAAPVVTIPLTGEGEGKVKLFTTSINIGIKYFPFK